MQAPKESESEFYPEIEIDDAGWGDLVGGVIIRGYNPLNREFRWEMLPVKYFQGEAFASKNYLVKASLAVNKILGDLRADRRFYSVAICTGYILNQAAISLLNNGWKLVRRKIGGPCQRLIEERFRKELLKIGVPSEMIVNLPSGTNRFIQLFDWVKEDPKARERFVKTGWKSWQSKWRPRLFKK